MFKTILITIFFLFISSETFAQSVAYKDPNGAAWTRWVITEKQGEGTLLLVVENPDSHQDDDSVSQQVLFRRSYLDSQIIELQKDQNYYLNLSDLDQRPKSYYDNLEISIRDSHLPLWEPVKEKWSIQDEENYTKWYQENITAEYTKGFGIKFDCADFGTLVRWIYAHDHKLPVANSIAGSSKLLGHFSGAAEWDKLPTNPDWKKDQRFKAAMAYVLKNIYTHSIMNDLYPVKLSKQYVTPGSILLNLYSSSSGHTQVITKIGNHCDGMDCIIVLYGNEPSNDIAYEDAAWIENKKQNEGGFLRWRWPVKKWYGWRLTDKEDMPGYSTEQYSQQDLESEEFIQFVYEKIGMTISPLSKALAALDSMTSQLGQRTNLTIAAYYLCHLQKCDPKSQLYSDYSTPSRDLRFHNSQNKFLRLLGEVPSSDRPALDAALEDLAQYTILSTRFNYRDYILDIDGISTRMNSDPTKSIFERWGLTGLDNFDRLKVLTFVWSFGFSSVREPAVNDGIQKCFQQNPNASTCNKNDAQVIALKTDRMDSGFKSERAKLKAAFSAATSEQQQQLSELTRYFYIVKDDACNVSGNTSGYCFATHFLFVDNNWVDRMSSLPWDLPRKRWGLE